MNSQRIYLHAFWCASSGYREERTFCRTDDNDAVYHLQVTTTSATDAQLRTIHSITLSQKLTNSRQSILRNFVISQHRQLNIGYGMSDHTTMMTNVVLLTPPPLDIYDPLSRTTLNILASREVGVAYSCSLIAYCISGKMIPFYYCNISVYYHVGSKALWRVELPSKRHYCSYADLDVTWYNWRQQTTHVTVAKTFTQQLELNQKQDTRIRTSV